MDSKVTLSTHKIHSPRLSTRPFPVYLYRRLPRLLLEHDVNIPGLTLSGNLKIKDQEYSDNTNVYLKGILENLNNVKVALETFSASSEAMVNWHKSKAILDLEGS